MKILKQILSVLMIGLFALVGCAESSGGKPEGDGGEDVKEEKTAKVVVISGQSNASGFTWSKCLKGKISDERYERFENGFENGLIYYSVDTIEEYGYTWSDGDTNTSGGKFVNVALGQGHTPERFGIEIGLCEKMAELAPEEKIYFIKCSWGSAGLSPDYYRDGVRMANFSSPSNENHANNSYWTKLVEVVHAGLEELKTVTGLPVEIVSLCWLQGEKDTVTSATANQYPKLLRNFVQDFRNEFSAYRGKKEIAFIDALLGDGDRNANGVLINEYKTWFAEQSPETNFIVETTGLSYQTEPEEKPDPYHYDSLAMLELGSRFASILLNVI